MSYIEKIRKNVTDALAIRKNAKSNNVDYITAKIMYHKGANDIDLETAKLIKNALKELNITSYMLDTFDKLYEDFLDFGFEENILNINIHYEINRKYIQELSNYFRADFYYGRTIANLMRKGISLENATRLFEIKLKHEMKKNNLSEIAGLAKILYYNNNEAAKIFEKAYLNGRASYLGPEHILKNELISNDEYLKKNINGITILSKTEKGLKKLETLVTEAFKKNNKEFGSLLSEEATKNNLLLSDINFSSHPGAYYDHTMKYIYIDDSYLNKLDEGITVFHHETTHFLDNIKVDNPVLNPFSFYSTDNPVINSLLKKMAENTNPVKKGLSLGYLNNHKAKKYANDHELNLKWMKEIIEKYPDLSNADYKILMQQKIITERKRFKLLSTFLSDIYDSLTGGKLRSYFGISGHGKKYYQFKKYIPMEFIANIGALYNANATDILKFELGDELAEELINMYHEFINDTKPNPKTR